MSKYCGRHTCRPKPVAAHLTFFVVISNNYYPCTKGSNRKRSDRKRYIYKPPKKHSLWGIMSARSCSQNAKTIFELCDQCNITLPTLQISCIFCKKCLTTTEVLSFAFRDLKVVWRDSYPFAACLACLKFYGKISQYRHFKYAALAVTVEEETQQTVFELCIRCCKCHKPLSPIEKVQHIVQKAHFFYISNAWKGYCLHCWKSCMEKRRRSETMC